MSTLLRKFKVVKCPFDGEVYRVHAFDVHMKTRHGHMPKAKEWMKRVKDEDSCLICVRGPSHRQPKLMLTVRTRGGNDVFINQHRECITNKLPSLTEGDKNLVREKLREANVDLDSSPSVADAIGVIESPSNYPLMSSTFDNTQDQEEIIHNLLYTPPNPKTTRTNYSGLETLFDESKEDSSESPVNVTAIEPSLMLDDGSPKQHEPSIAQLFDDVYQHIYEPGLQYPQQRDAQTSPMEQHDAVLPPAPSTLDVSSQTSPKAQQDAASQAKPMQHDTATSVMEEAAEKQDSTEDIPLLQLSQEHFREVNRMKNVMLTQLMQDNIHLLENKLQSRKRALRAMENLFEARTQQQNLSEDFTLELSHIIHLKNKLIQQLLKETGQIHAHVYNTMTHN